MATKVKEIVLSDIRGSKLPLIIGYFGSVHVMHSQLLDKFHRYNVLTFTDFKAKSKSQLYKFNERINNIAEFNPQNIFVFNINRNNMKAQEFIDRVLIPLKPSSILVGSDFKFGSDHKPYTVLCQYFQVDTIRHNKNVSSSIIANLLANRQVERANCLLYKPYYYISKWIKGDHRGTEIGYKTMNLLVDHPLVLAEGSYAAKVKIGPKTHKCVAFVGKSKTFKIQETKLEIHVYNKRIMPRTLVPNSFKENVKVEFYKFIRANKQFKNQKQLAQAIEKDIKVAKAFFERNK